ncbi:MAG: hypothetical protein IJP91_08110, partial [Synergistaceae bacterium]|nr:hypothetical protein [Synergistaceae bacterium]
MNKFSNGETSMGNLKTASGIGQSSENNGTVHIIGNGKTLTFNDVTNPNGKIVLFKTKELNVSDLNLVLGSGLTGFYPEAGRFDNVTFEGGQYGMVYRYATDTIYVIDCKFNSQSTAGIDTDHAVNADIINSEFNGSNVGVFGTFDDFTGNKITDATLEVGTGVIAAFVSNDLSGASVDVNVSTTDVAADLSQNYWGDTVRYKVKRGNGNVILSSFYEDEDFSTLAHVIAATVWDIPSGDPEAEGTRYTQVVTYYKSVAAAVSALAGSNTDVVTLMADASYALSGGQVLKVNKNGHNFDVSVPDRYELRTTHDDETGVTTYSAAEVAPQVADGNFSVAKGHSKSYTLSDTAGSGNRDWVLTSDYDWVTIADSDDVDAKIITAAPPAAIDKGVYQVSVTVTNTEDATLTDSADINITVTASTITSGDENIDEGIYIGTPSEAPVTEETDDGQSITTTKTEFMSGIEKILGTEIAITTESTDIAGVVGEDFFTVVSVDVSVDVVDPDFKTYGYSLDISELPAGLEVVGEMLFSDDVAEHFLHVFTIEGEPSKSGDVVVKIKPIITVSSDVLALVSIASKDVTLRISDPEPELESVNVAISGETELTLDFGESKELAPFVVTVSGDFSDGTMRQLPPESYDLTWALDVTPSTDGISLDKDGILSVSSDTAADTYEAVVMVTATVGEFSDYDELTVIVTVNEPEPVNPPVAPTIDDNTMTVAKGGSNTLALTDTTGTEAREWTLNSDAPEWVTLTQVDDANATLRATPPVTVNKGAYQVTVTVTNVEDATLTDDAIITITVTGSAVATPDEDLGEGTYIGTPSDDPVTEIVDDQSITTTKTEFKSGTTKILGTEIAITTESTDLIGKVGEEFFTVVSVDVSVDVIDPDFNDYDYWLEISELPEGLDVFGDISVVDDVAEHFTHVFRIEGEPVNSGDVVVNIKPIITVSSDVLSLISIASKDVTIRISEAEEPGPAPNPEAELVRVNVAISGETELTLNFGESKDLAPFVVTVSGDFSDGTMRLLPPESYDLTWDLEVTPDTDGISLDKDGVLSVSSDTAADT